MARLGMAVECHNAGKKVVPEAASGPDRWDRSGVQLVGNQRSAAERGDQVPAGAIGECGC